MPLMPAAPVDEVRVGLLGTSTVAVYGMIEPARAVAGVSVVSVGSRDVGRARAYAERHGIAGWGGYDAVIADPGVDAIYIGLPNNLHAEWSLCALRAGKAVLCEKPLAMNTAATAQLAAEARAIGGVFVEAFHWRCHPVAARLRRLVAEGEIGAVRSIDGRFRYPRSAMLRDDFRLDYARGGGVMMDAGCYVVNLMRLLLGEPVGLRSAKAVLEGPEIDVEMDAALDFAGGATGRLNAANRDAGDAYDIVVTITGETGQANVINPFLTGFGNGRIDIAADERRWSEPIDPTPTYAFQAAHFADVVRGRAASLMTPEDAVANLAVVDMVYRGAGLHPRGMDLDYLSETGARG
jgi:predicted dehydrogenase